MSTDYSICVMCLMYDSSLNSLERSDEIDTHSEAALHLDEFTDQDVQGFAGHHILIL